MCVDIPCVRFASIPLGCSPAGARRRYLEEVSSCNVFSVKGKVIKTPPLQGTILPGVTRSKSGWTHVEDGQSFTLFGKSLVPQELWAGCKAAKRCKVCRAAKGVGKLQSCKRRALAAKEGALPALA
eukprot:scaffold21644_cov20-Tisochrysis_lutea.AAC.1